MPRDEAERLRRDDIGPQVKEPTCSGDLRKPVTEGRSKTVDRGPEHEGDPRRQQQDGGGQESEHLSHAHGRQRRGRERQGPHGERRQRYGSPGRHGAERDADHQQSGRRPTFAHRERAEGRPDQNHEADDGALQRRVGVLEQAKSLASYEPGRGGPGRERGRHEAQGKEVEVGSPGALGQQRDGKADQDDRAGFLDPTLRGIDRKRCPDDRRGAPGEQA